MRCIFTSRVLYSVGCEVSDALYEIFIRESHPSGVYDDWKRWVAECLVGNEGIWDDFA